MLAKLPVFTVDVIAKAVQIILAMDMTESTGAKPSPGVPPIRDLPQQKHSDSELWPFGFGILKYSIPEYLEIDRK